LGVTSTATSKWTSHWEIPIGQTARCQLIDNFIIAEREKHFYIEFTMGGPECSPKYSGSWKAFPEILEKGSLVRFEAFYKGIVGDQNIKGIISIEGDKLTFIPEEKVEGEKVTLKRIIVKPTVNWVGTWKMKGKSKDTPGSSCALKDEVVIADEGSSLVVSWIWESSDGCESLELNGKKFVSFVPTPVDDNPLVIYIRVWEFEIERHINVAQDIAVWSSDAPFAVIIFERSSNSSFFIIALILLAGIVTVGVVLLILKSQKGKELSRTLANNSSSHLMDNS